MKAFLAIVQQTMRSAIRAKVFHILSFFIALTVFWLPLKISGDGTASGLMQISLTYTLGIVVVLISATTLWLSCSQLSREIEAYNIHFVLSKPCPRWKLWLGKWTGIFGMHAVILVISAFCIFWMIQGRIAYETKQGRFSKDEIFRLNKEIRVGRKMFRAEPPDLTERIEKEFRSNPANLKESPRQASLTRAALRRDILQKEGDVPPGTMKTWTFKNISAKSGEIFFKYRMYSGATSANKQRDMPCIWGVKAPTAPKDVIDPYVNNLMYVMGGSYQELLIGSEFIDKENDNSITIRILNPPKGHDYWKGAEATSAMFQPADGPYILVAMNSFANNYCRAIFLALLQIAFLAALGCTVSAAFSTPVAAFVAVTYLIMGLSVSAAIDAPLKKIDGSYEYTYAIYKPLHYMARGLGHIVVSVDDLDATSELAAGHLIENERLKEAVLWLFLCKTGFISLVGLWILNKRELGAVIRK